RAQPGAGAIPLREGDRVQAVVCAGAHPARRYAALARRGGGRGGAVEESHRARSGQLARADVPPRGSDGARQAIDPAAVGERRRAAHESARYLILREAYARLRGGALTPARLAGSLAVGLAIGLLPLYGLHLALVLAVCLPLRFDSRLSYVAANVSIP